MRIVHVLLTSRFAGTERHVVDLVEAQAKMGHEVALVLRRKAAQRRPDAIAHRVSPGIRVVLVEDWLARWPAVAQARKVVQRMKPDVAHAHLGSGCRALQRVNVCPRVSTLHLRYKPQQHARMDGLIAIAPWQLNEIPETLRMRTVQIDNWTVPRHPAPDARSRLRAEFGIREDEFLFGALGRIEYGKGMDVLVEAFKQADIGNARLAIIGQGSQWKRVRGLAPVDAVMPGFSIASEEWMAAFDCFVSPARDEPFGLVLLEAMQAGLPIVATASAGGRHLVEAIGQPLVPLEDPAALAAALRVAFTAGKTRVAYPMDGFRVEQKAREIEAFYASTIALWQ